MSTPKISAANALNDLNIRQDLTMIIAVKNSMQSTYIAYFTKSFKVVVNVSKKNNESGRLLRYVEMKTYPTYRSYLFS